MLGVRDSETVLSKNFSEEEDQQNEGF